jgi:hypothetical protein
MSETTNPKAHVVRLPDDVIAKCSSYAADVAARYGGDDLHAMPWTRDQTTDEECQQWLASRKEAALKIDIETCELGRWAANDFDPYGLRTDLTEEMYQIGTNRFIRSPDSGGWVCEDDLPLDKLNAMYDRIHREADTYENYLKQPKDSRELWQANDDLWRVVSNYSCFIRWADGRAAAARELQNLGEYLRKWQELHPDQVDLRAGNAAAKAVCDVLQRIITPIAKS